MRTQNAQVLAWLKRGLPITPLDALKFMGCFRLAARVWELRQEGYPILTLREPEGYARYVLQRKKRAA